MTSRVYDLDNVWTLNKKCLRVPPPAPPCYLNVTLLGFQSETLLEMVFPDTEGQKATETRKSDS